MTILSIGAFTIALNLVIMLAVLEKDGELGGVSNSFSIGLSPLNRFLKRSLDIAVSALGLILTSWIILAASVIARIDTGNNGFFTQHRVGRNGRLFKVIKIRTMVDIPEFDTTVTTSADPRITKIGGLIRRLKIDELPQLFNVLIGHMSLVGPRPDVPGFADTLEGEDRIILSVRPGLTGPVTLRYRNEENLLALQDDPERYNREVIYPEKVRLNREYIRNYSIWTDLKIVLQTVFG